MLNIRAEFPNRRSRAFLKFLAEAQTIHGYQQITDEKGKPRHRVDFTEPGYIKITGSWGYYLEHEWHGVYYLDDKIISLTRLWQRHLRSADVMDRTVCPACGTALGELPLIVNFIIKPGFNIDHFQNCICGADITGIYTTAHAISTAKTPAELVKKSRGEL